MALVQSNNLSVNSTSSIHDVETPETISSLNALMTVNRKAQRAKWRAVRIKDKLAILVVLSVLTGTSAGIVGENLGWGIGAFVPGLMVAILLVIPLSHVWISVPLDRLTHHLRRLSGSDRTELIKQLPASRGDEVGQLARSVQHICIRSIKHRHEAHHLRRTLDHRIAEATRRATSQLQRIAQRDPLTDLGNRRFLDEHLDPLANIVADTGEDLACIMIDLDNFKAVNDTLGHSAGDDLLVFLGSLLQGSIRHDDLAVRLGGDEFAVFMPGTTAERLMSFAKAITKHFRQQVRAMHPQGPWADLSIGISTMKRDGAETGHQLLEIADQKLYDAKREGKGRIVGLEDV